MADVIGQALCLVGVGFWEPSADASVGPGAALLGARARGRASLLTLMFAEVVEKAARSARFSLSEVATIYGSAFGEMERLIQLLEGLGAPKSEVSPLRFQTSVHNASGGQLSIATHNPRFSTSLAAGRETVAMGFVEAAAWMACYDAELLLVLGDEGSPPRVHSGPSSPPLAAAFAFSPARSAPPEALRLTVERSPRAAMGLSEHRPLDANPCEPLRDLVGWLGRAPRDAFSLNEAGPTEYCLVPQ